MEWIQNMMQMQMDAMQIQTNMMNAAKMAMPSGTRALTMKDIKVPEGRHDMTVAELRTYIKDIRDYKILTQLTDEHIVLRLRMNMDSTLKRAIDINAENWNTSTLDEAIKHIEKIVKKATNPVVTETEFNNMKQNSHESFIEYLTRLKTCGAECNFVCLYEPTHDLTGYHLIGRIRSGV